MGITNFDKQMTAMAFAEAGEHETAKEMLGQDEEKKPSFSPARGNRKPYLKTIIFGAISLSAYVVLFKNEQLITSTFTMGGWHAAFPVATAFFFSFFHGAFAGNLLSTLGLEAKK